MSVCLALMCTAQTQKHFSLVDFTVLLKNAVWKEQSYCGFEEKEKVEVQVQSAIYSVISYSFKVESLTHFQKHVNNFSLREVSSFLRKE